MASVCMRLDKIYFESCPLGIVVIGRRIVYIRYDLEGLNLNLKERKIIANQFRVSLSAWQICVIDRFQN